ncbi:hypothetical protein Tco_0313959 [Tanacetum coccineum]
MSNALFARITEDTWAKHEEDAVNYADLKASIDDYYDENIAHKDQTDKLVEASMSSLEKSSNTINDLYKGLNIITELLKVIKNDVKDNTVINKKITKATESFTKFSINITDLQSSMNTLQAHALKQDEELAAWAKSSTNMAWNLGSRISGLERAQNHIQSSMSSLKEDTHSINNMMTEMYEVFKGQSLGSVTPTLALTHILANVEEENETNTAIEEPPSHTEGEIGEPKREIPISTIQPTEVPPTQAQPITIIITHPKSSQAAPRSDKGKRIATESDEDPSKRLVHASTIVRPDLDEEVKVPLMVNGKMYYLTDKEIQAYLDKEEKLRKAAKEERLLAISKPEVIKVVQEEAKKIGLDPKKITSAKAGEKFKKAQDAEHQTKRVVITVYRGSDGRNFDVHKPFAFGAFGISKLDELREIIPKKKNEVVQDLMNSLSRRYESIRKIPEELRIKSALPAPAPVPEQALSKSSRKKRKHMELEPEIKIPGLECNQALPKNVPFVNNMVIEEPEYGIFFTDEFGDQSFQRWSNIDKVRMEALVSYLLAASLVQSPENARFSIKLKKLIAEHLDQEKLESKKVKLEALGYEMN